MKQIRLIEMPGMAERVETGAVQFGKADWPGLFVRGDQAFALSRAFTVIAKNFGPKHLEGDPTLRLALAQIVEIVEIIDDHVDVSGDPRAAEIIQAQMRNEV